MSDEIKRDWLEKDFYKSLGVSKKADDKEIKKAYRKLARELHPDANPNNKEAEERFKEVSEAYDVLSDPKTRKQYDEARSLGGRIGNFGGFGGGRGPAGGQNFSMSDLSDLFGQGAGGNQGGFSDVFGGLFNRGGQHQRPVRGHDIESEVTLSFTDALNGVTLPLRLQMEGPCPTCGGSGAKPGTAPQPCSACQGTGSRVRNQGGFAFSEPCPVCMGRGAVIGDPCPTCHGTGEGTNTKTINARIPAGVRDGQKIRLKSKGGPGEHGGANGDLFIVVHVTRDPVFGRDGNNVTLTVPVAFDEAALGANIVVPTPDGSTVTLKVPAGTANGRKFRVRGRGAATKTPGDLVVTVTIAVPATLSDEQTVAVEALRTARGDTDPRADLMAKVGESR